jgi:hypothetical protein
MDAFLNGATLIEATLLSILLGLWITWIGLSGLFRLMPAAKLEAAPIRLAARRSEGSSSHQLA